jgi:hypothetical protein
MKHGQTLVQSDGRAQRARPSRSRRATLLFAGVVAVGGLALTFALRSLPAAPPPRPRIAAAQTPEASARHAELARLLTVLATMRPEPSPAQRHTSDAPRDAAPVDPDHVGTVIPMLRGMPKVKQLEILKAMMLLPDNKLMSQMPQLANAREKPLSERRALAQELGTQLISSLEDEGVEYELPPGYTPVGAPLEPPPDSQAYPE